jgi:hypothetical protein
MPAPLPHMPERPANARTTEPSESTRQRWARMAKIEATAREAAHADGVRQGYQHGWRWGLWCGIAAGAVVASIGWAVWLTATAPQAAPPSAGVPMVLPRT